MDEGLLIATWWGVGVAALFGLAGLIVGIVGLVQARSARGTAASANVIAKDANAVARKANDFAKEANEISRDANAIATGQAEKSGELHRIDWDFRWVGLGVYQIGNKGPDPATKVHAQITVAHETKTVEVERLEAGEAATLLFPKVKELLELVPEKNVRGEYRMGVPPVTIRQLVTWYSPMGNPQKHDDTDRGARLQ